MNKRRWIRLLQVLLVLGLLFEIGRQQLLSHSLYELNLHAVPTLDVMPAPRIGQRILIFAPHEDDETLGAGGYIQQAVAARASVHVALMTNGEYPELSLILFEERLPINAAAFISLGYDRQRETLAAMRLLGIPSKAVTFLGYPNQYLDQMWQPAHWRPENAVRSIRTRSTSSPYINSFTPGAMYCGSAMLRDIEALLYREQPDVVITLHPNDIHPDHWPTYAVVEYALRELSARGESFAARCVCYTYLIHRSHWPAVRGYHPVAALMPPTALVNNDRTRWLALPLTLAQTIDKHKAIDTYRSQGGAIDPLLQSFARANELFGLMPTGTWLSTPRTPTTTIIIDPAADLDASAATPAGDITEVTLARDARMKVVIHTRGKPARNVNYHFALHAGDGRVDHRVIAAYDTAGRNAGGALFANGQTRPLSAPDVQVSYGEDAVTLTAPWPLPDSTLFFLARAWTTRGRRTIDLTAETPYRIALPPPADEVLAKPR